MLHIDDQNASRKKAMVLFNPLNINMFVKETSTPTLFDSYSYKLWHLAKTWNNLYQFPLLPPPPLRPNSPVDLAGVQHQECLRCHVKFTSVAAFTEHLEAVHAPKLDDELTVERVQETLNDVTSLSCKTCNKTFANVYRLQRHMISHDESTMLRKFKCSHCEKAFKFKHHLKEHLRIHSGEKPFECSNCGKRFSHSGSFSSHTTSKKCLLMNIKLGKARLNSNSNSSPTKIPNDNPNCTLPQNSTLLNNNVLSTLNHNTFLPILPKYSPDAAAFLSTFPTSYNLPLNSIPTAAQLRQFYLDNTPLQLPYHLSTKSPSESMTKEVDNTKKSPPSGSLRNSCSSSEENLVIDIEDNSPDTKNERLTPNPSRDLTSVQHILETVNATIAKQFLQDVEVERPKVESEGLAAKLEDTVKVDEASLHSENFSINEDDMDVDDNSYQNEGEECATDDSRKVRIRSLFTDEQLEVLKGYYNLNQRPNKKILTMIGEQIGFSVRVVRVWFQNTRARDRRENRIIPAPTIPNFLLNTTSPITTDLSSSPSLSPNTAPSDEQPLDLSVKKNTHANTNSIQHRYPSISSPSESFEDSFNLSQKSATSPLPQLRYVVPPADSSPHTLPRYNIMTPNESRLAQILAQPSTYNNVSETSSSNMKLFDYHNLNLNFNWDLMEKKFDLKSKFEFKIKSSINSIDGRSEHFTENGEQESQEQFVCDQCDKAFSKQSSLARHKYEHSGQRPHKCDKCPKAFKHKHHLTEHKRLHSGEKPFQCGKCLKRFSHSGSYSQHMNHRYSYCKPYRE